MKKLIFFLFVLFMPIIPASAIVFDADFINKTVQSSFPYDKQSAVMVVYNPVVARSFPTMQNISDMCVAGFDDRKTQLNKCATFLDILLAHAEEQQKLISAYNAKLKPHKDFVAQITDADCVTQFQEYITYINAKSYATDILPTDAEMVIKYDLIAQQNAYKVCEEKAIAARKAEEERLERERLEQERLEQERLSQQCPDVNPRLKSLNSSNKIGDFCNYGNVTVGKVFKFKSGTKRSGVDVGGTCSCTATACKSGYIVQGGVCVEASAAQKNIGGADACARSEHAWTEENNFQSRCELFCVQHADTNKCKYINAITLPAEEKCICNPSTDEYGIETARLNNLQYREVCDKNKSARAANEFCIDEEFNWTNTGINQALSMAQDWAQINHDRMIQCNNQHRLSYNDDFIKCVSLDGKYFYEFQFDDVKESFDKDRQADEKAALCEMLGGKTNFALSKIASYYILPGNNIRLGLVGKCEGINDAQCSQLNELSQKYGYVATWQDSSCGWATAEDAKRVATEEFEASLARIDGVDNRAYYNIQVIMVRANFNLTDEVTGYLKSKTGARTVSCSAGYQTKTVADGWFAALVTDTDDIWRCYADGKPVDFVIDDLSEAWGYQRSAGEDGAKCVTNDGKFDGHYCRGLTESECYELEDKILAELRKTGWAGDSDIVDWDASAGACELNSAQFANNFNKVGKYGALAGLTIGGVFTGGTTTAIAWTTMSVELAGFAGEIYIDYAKKMLPQEWADEFLAQSKRCNNQSCAEATLKENTNKLNDAYDSLNKDVIAQVDNELARLAYMIPADRFQDIIDNAEEISGWEDLRYYEYICSAMQLAGVVIGAVSGFKNFAKVVKTKVPPAAIRVNKAGTAWGHPFTGSDGKIYYAWTRSPKTPSLNDVIKFNTPVRVGPGSPQGGQLVGDAIVHGLQENATITTYIMNGGSFVGSIANAVHVTNTTVENEKDRDIDAAVRAVEGPSVPAFR